jgi:hypothetical protein
MPAPARLTEDRLLAALRRHGGRARLRELGPELGVHRATLHRHFQRLVSNGLVEPAGRGEYQLALPQLGLGDDAARVVGVLETGGLAAHLTGFDLLISYAHQFVFLVPHVVYAEPMALDGVELELAANDFVVWRADGGGRVSIPASSQLVVLRKQPDAERYRVHGYVAPVEKGWVDALREASRGTVPLQFMELGRILRALVDGGADVRFLRHYARQLGYLDRVDAAMGDAPGTATSVAAPARESAELGQLRAGFQA